MDKQFIEDIVADVRADYEQRGRERRQFEAQWQLNTNFVLGNQYCRIGVKGDVEDTERDYFWQEREVYNHLATIVETRLAKLGRIRPSMSVLPASGDDGDVRTAKASGKILKAACARLNMDELIRKATMWSELTGSSFYKISWDRGGGRVVGSSDGKTVREGDVCVSVCPPYEIFPDSLINQTVDECRSIIHAKAVAVEDVKLVWGKDVEAEETDVVSMDNIAVTGGLGLSSAVSKMGREKRDGHVTVIERYTRPTADKPNGELVIIAGKQLLHYGELPYMNGCDGERGFPFVRQDGIARAGCFFGTSMVERAIPIQRAYNAVKNRKHEFLNRIAMGVLCVEDGSVDTDNLETEGISPGKILVYRQGAAPPALMNPGSVPSDFTIEEQRLLSEFIDVSGISEIMRSSTVPSSVTSGTAIQMLVEQDDTRLSVTADNVRRAVKGVAKQILRLYKQFASTPRLARFVGDDGEVELLSFMGSELSSEDVTFDTENEISQTAASKQSLTLELLKSGLLYDENGRLSETARYKLLESLGYGGWERTQNVSAMHVSKASKENADIERAEVSELDDHALHVDEHTRYFLSGEFADAVRKKPELKDALLEHVRKHKSYARTENEAQGEIKL